MKRKILSITVVVGILLIYSSLFGAEDIKTLTFDEKHKDGQFIFLIDDVDITVNKDWSYVTKVHKKVKILKEESKDMGEIPIYYENGKEKVTNIKASTVTPDNKKHQYSKIQDFKLYAGYPMYSDSMVKIITLPEVTIGSVLEHEYTIISKDLPIKNAFWYIYAVDSITPMKELKFSITMPKDLGIQYKEFGLTRKPKIAETKSNITYSWVEQDIDGSKNDEDYLPPPTPESFEETFEFSSIKDWRDISNWYLSLVKKNLKINSEIEDTVKKIISGHTALKDKTRAILQYIQDNFRYVSMAFGNNAMEPHPTVQVFKNKYGDCKDLSLLTMAMLKIAGIDSEIALFNTEYSLSDPQYDLPIPTLFNHVLLLVKDSKDGDFYIDPLLNGYDIGQYPLAYQGAYTFVITEDDGKFGKFPIFDEKRNYTYVKRTITIGEDSSALIETEMLWELDSSVEQRHKLNAMDKEQKDKFYEALDAYISSGGQILERRIDGLDKKYGSLKTYSKIKRNDEFPVTDGIMVIDVAGYDRGLGFTKKERKKPIFYSGNFLNEEITVYQIPKRYIISYAPKDLNLDNGFFSIKREYIKGQNEIKITEVTRYKRIGLPKEDYTKIKDFYDELPAKTQQRIILKKAD